MFPVSPRQSRPNPLSQTGGGRQGGQMPGGHLASGRTCRGEATKCTAPACRTRSLRSRPGSDRPPRPPGPRKIPRPPHEPLHDRPQCARRLDDRELPARRNLPDGSCGFHGRGVRPGPAVRPDACDYKGQCAFAITRREDAFLHHSETPSTRPTRTPVVAGLARGRSPDRASRP